MDRLIPRTRLSQLVGNMKRRKLSIVFTNGVFDLLHRGHVEYLARARSFGDVLIVGLNTDASVRRLKGPSRPLQSEKDRAAVLLALRSVDYVVLFTEDTPARVIAEIKPAVLVKGADYKESEIVGAALVKSYGGKVRRVRLSRGRSTSSLIRRIEAANK